MKYIHNSKEMRSRRQELRRNATQQEIKLWTYLKKKQCGFLFYRQHSIGPYVVDFYCPQKRLIIELDGNQHVNNKEYDTQRTLFLNHLNFKVLRFWNYEINSTIEKVVEEIKSNVTSSQ